MPQLPNSPDVNTKEVTPLTNPNLPDDVGLNAISKEVSAPNFVEHKVDLLPLVTPPTDFVSQKLDQFGQKINEDKNIDPEFERWFAQQSPKVDPAIKQKELSDKTAKYSKIIDDLNKESTKLTENATTAPRRALKQVGIGA